MVKRYLWRYPKERRSTVIGPNCAGIISPGKAMLGIMPGHIYQRGTVGLVTRSGTLGYEAASQMKALGIGITTSVGIGGDPINGSSFVDILQRFEEDPETEAVMMIGEIGGPQEAEAALAIAKEHMRKPVIGYVAGLTAPKGRRMGHAGAIIRAFGESAAEKVEIMREAGLTVVPEPGRSGRDGGARAGRAVQAGGGRRRERASHGGGDAPPARAGACRRWPARSTRGSIPTTVRSRRTACARRSRRPTPCSRTVTDKVTAEVLVGRAAPREAGGQFRCRLQQHRHRGRQGARHRRLQHAGRADRRHRRPRDHAAADGGAPRRRGRAPSAGRAVDRLAADPHARHPRHRQDARASSAWGASPGRSPSGRTTASG